MTSLLGIVWPRVGIERVAIIAHNLQITSTSSRSIIGYNHLRLLQVHALRRVREVPIGQELYGHVEF